MQTALQTEDDDKGLGMLTQCSAHQGSEPRNHAAYTICKSIRLMKNRLMQCQALKRRQNYRFDD